MTGRDLLCALAIAVAPVVAAKLLEMAFPSSMCGQPPAPNEPSSFAVYVTRERGRR